MWLQILELSMIFFHDSNPNFSLDVALLNLLVRLKLLFWNVLTKMWRSIYQVTKKLHIFSLKDHNISSVQVREPIVLNRVFTINTNLTILSTLILKVFWNTKIVNSSVTLFLRLRRCNTPLIPVESSESKKFQGVDPQPAHARLVQKVEH